MRIFLFTLWHMVILWVMQKDFSLRVLGARMATNGAGMWPYGKFAWSQNIRVFKKDFPPTVWPTEAPLH